MRIGFHVSIAGGFARAAHRARNLGCTTLQIFSQNPRSWKRTPLDADDVADFGRLREEFDLQPCAVHLPYLPNIAAPAEEAWKRSLELLTRTLQRAEALGAELLVVHPGSHAGGGVRAGCDRAAAAHRPGHHGNTEEKRRRRPAQHAHRAPVDGAAPSHPRPVTCRCNGKRGGRLSCAPLPGG